MDSINCVDSLNKNERMIFTTNPYREFLIVQTHSCHIKIYYVSCGRDEEQHIAKE